MTETSKGHRKRLRERFQKMGLRSFSEHEILELLLTLCIPRRDVKGLAKALLKNFKSTRAVFDADAYALLKIPGMGEASVTCLKLIKSLSEYYLQQKTTEGSLFNNNQSLIDFWQARLEPLTNEVFEVAYLDNAYRLLNDGIERLEEGSATHATIYPPKIIRTALLRNANAIVIAHNHPSGIAEPSQADFRLTQTLQYVGNVLSIRMLDHIIIGRNSFYSFRQSGFLE